MNGLYTNLVQRQTKEQQKPADEHESEVDKPKAAVQEDTSAIASSSSTTVSGAGILYFYLQNININNTHYVRCTTRAQSPLKTLNPII